MVASEAVNQFELNILREGDAWYAEACSFVRKHYLKRLGCELSGFYPIILARVFQGRITAACGIRPAERESLFLEQYLDHPINALLSEDRSRIVELGGFSADSRIEAFLLMKDIAPWLHAQGFLTVVCTANRPIRGCLRRLGIPFKQLAMANSSKLIDASEDWGSYYETAPLVLAGDIAEGVNSIDRMMQAA